MKDEEKGALVLAFVATLGIGYYIGRNRSRDDLVKFMLISALRNREEK